MKHFNTGNISDMIIIIIAFALFIIVCITVGRQIGAWFRAEAHQKKREDIDTKTGDIFSNILIGGIVIFIALLLMKGCFDH